MKPHLPPHTFRPGEVLILNDSMIRIFASTPNDYEFYIVAPAEHVHDDPVSSTIFEDPFLTDWKIFEVSGKMSRETPGELERRNAMVEEERFKIVANVPGALASLKLRYGRDLDTILKNQPPPSKHFSAPPLLANPYIPVLPPEHRPNLHITA